MKTIGDCAFSITKLKNVTLPNGLTTIGAEAFRGCTELESITIPSSVTSIGNNAFNGSTGKIYIYNGNTYNKFNVTEEIANAWGTTLENIEFMPDVMPETVADLKIGDCVTYVDGNGQEYESYVISEGANPEIALTTVKEITIGGSDFDTVVESYNNAYQAINEAANSYINPKFAKSARAFNTTGATTLGTKDIEIPNHGTVTFTDYSSYYTYEYESPKIFSFGLPDSFFDSTAVPGAGELILDYYGGDSGEVRIYSAFTGLNTEIYLWYQGEEYFESGDLGAIPVITLNTGVKVNGGYGTTTTPFTLGE